MDSANHTRGKSTHRQAWCNALTPMFLEPRSRAWIFCRRRRCQLNHPIHTHTRTAPTSPPPHQLQWLVNVEDRRPVAQLLPRPLSPLLRPSASTQLLLLLPQQRREDTHHLRPRRRLLHRRDQGCLARWLAPLRKYPPCIQKRTCCCLSNTNTTLTPSSGVAVGSSIGHAVGGWFSGGSSSEPAAASPQNTDFAAQHQDPAAAASNSQMQSSGACASDVNNFRKCMDENQGSLTICGWYLDQLKACQAAAGPY